MQHLHSPTASSPPPGYDRERRPSILSGSEASQRSSPAWSALKSRENMLPPQRSREDIISQIEGIHHVVEDDVRNTVEGVRRVRKLVKKRVSPEAPSSKRLISVQRASVPLRSAVPGSTLRRVSSGRSAPSPSPRTVYRASLSPSATPPTRTRSLLTGSRIVSSRSSLLDHTHASLNKVTSPYPLADPLPRQQSTDSRSRPIFSPHSASSLRRRASSSGLNTPRAGTRTPRSASATPRLRSMASPGRTTETLRPSRYSLTNSLSSPTRPRATATRVASSSESTRARAASSSPIPRVPSSSSIPTRVSSAASQRAASPGIVTASKSPSLSRWAPRSPSAHRSSSPSIKRRVSAQSSVSQLMPSGLGKHSTRSTSPTGVRRSTKSTRESTPHVTPRTVTSTVSKPQRDSRDSIGSRQSIAAHVEAALSALGIAPPRLEGAPSSASQSPGRSSQTRGIIEASSVQRLSPVPSGSERVDESRDVGSVVRGSVGIRSREGSVGLSDLREELELMNKRLEDADEGRMVVHRENARLRVELDMLRGENDMLHLEKQQDAHCRQVIRELQEKITVAVENAEKAAAVNRELANETYELKAQIEAAREREAALNEHLEMERARARSDRAEIDNLRDALSSARQDAERARLDGGKAERVQLDAVQSTLERLRAELKRVLEEREALLDERGSLVDSEQNMRAKMQAHMSMHEQEMELSKDIATRAVLRLESEIDRVREIESRARKETEELMRKEIERIREEEGKSRLAAETALKELDSVSKKEVASLKLEIEERKRQLQEALISASNDGDRSFGSPDSTVKSAPYQPRPTLVVYECVRCKQVSSEALDAEQVRAKRETKLTGHAITLNDAHQELKVTQDVLNECRAALKQTEERLNHALLSLKEEEGRRRHVEERLRNSLARLVDEEDGRQKAGEKIISVAKGLAEEQEGRRLAEAAVEELQKDCEVYLQELFDVEQFLLSEVSARDAIIADLEAEISALSGTPRDGHTSLPTTVLSQASRYGSTPPRGVLFPPSSNQKRFSPVHSSSNQSATAAPFHSDVTPLLVTERLQRILKGGVQNQGATITSEAPTMQEGSTPLFHKTSVRNDPHPPQPALPEPALATDLSTETAIYGDLSTHSNSSRASMRDHVARSLDTSKATPVYTYAHAHTHACMHASTTQHEDHVSRDLLRTASPSSQAHARITHRALRSPASPQADPPRVKRAVAGHSASFEAWQRERGSRLDSLGIGRELLPTPERMFGGHQL